MGAVLGWFFHPGTIIQGLELTWDNYDTHIATGTWAKTLRMQPTNGCLDKYSGKEIVTGT